ncbi:MAG: Asp-tRNA(Asn)/Glu-tRNA(Gln) amidotransferase subunit GatC [Bacteroidetes bacterium]|nr:MAG: Asp-tRNA(Asn)/Glu-tRNA(Gln) amidotransferase subunit GatC [Bacteroidota bacterium]
MQVNEKMVDHLAHLSRLEFSPAEKVAMMADLEKMTAFVEKLNELDTTGVEPLRHMAQATNVWRPDAVESSMTHHDALSNAQNHNGDFFLVPKVITREA